MKHWARHVLLASFAFSFSASADISVNALKTTLLVGEPLYLVATSNSGLPLNVWSDVTIRAGESPAKRCRAEFDQLGGNTAPAPSIQSDVVLASAICGADFALMSPGLYEVRRGDKHFEVKVVPIPKRELAAARAFKWDGGFFAPVPNRPEYLRQFPDSVFSGYVALRVNHPSGDTGLVLPPGQAAELWRHVESAGSSQEERAAAVRYLQTTNEQCAGEVEFWSRYLPRHTDYPLSGLAELRMSSCFVYDRDCAKARNAADRVMEPWYAAAKAHLLGELAQVEKTGFCKTKAKE